MLTFNDEPDAIGVDRLIVPEWREQITRQRRDFMREMAADEKATGWAATLEPPGTPRATYRLLPTVPPGGDAGQQPRSRT